MNDLVQSQIQDSCKLALPNGLKELMWDISREVLRAQPADLCSFISEYLLALLVTRENSAVAYNICGDVCNEICKIPLDEALRNVDFTIEDAAIAMEIAENMFDLEEVKECAILSKIFELESMTEDKLEAVKDALCKAYLIHKHPNLCKSPSDLSDLDAVDQAVHHTLRLYRSSKPSDEEYNRAATNIQAAYRAYGVRRHMGGSLSNASDHGTDTDQDRTPYYQQDDLFSETDAHGRVYTVMSDEYIKSIRFHHEDPCDPDPNDVFKLVVKTEVPEDSKDFKRSSLQTVSSTSLAGSFVNLPKFKPYTPISEVSEPEDNTDDGQEGKPKLHENRDGKLSEKEINVKDYNEVDNDAGENTAKDSGADKNVVEVYTKRLSVDEDVAKRSVELDIVEYGIVGQEKGRGSDSEGSIVRSSIKKDTSMRGSVVKYISVRGSIAKDASVRDSVVKDASVRGSVAQDISARGSTVKDTSARGSVVKDASVRDSVVKDTSARSSVVKDASVRGSVEKETYSRGSIVKDASVRGSVVKDTSLRGSVVKDPSVKGSVLIDVYVRGSVVKDATERESVVKDASVRESIINDASVRGSVAKDATTRDSAVNIVKGSIARHNSLEGPLMYEQESEVSVVNESDVRESVVHENNVRGSVGNDNSVIKSVVNDNAVKDSLVRSSFAKHSSARSSVIKNIVTENNKVKDIEYSITEDNISIGTVDRDIEEQFVAEKNMIFDSIAEEDIDFIQND